MLGSLAGLTMCETCLGHWTTSIILVNILKLDITPVVVVMIIAHSNITRLSTNLSSVLSSVAPKFDGLHSINVDG